MISSICWLPRGAAKSVPVAAPMTDEELTTMRERASDLAAGVLEVFPEHHTSCCVRVLLLQIRNHQSLGLFPCLFAYMFKLCSTRYVSGRFQGSDAEDANDAEPSDSSSWETEGDDDSMDVETAVAKAKAAAEAITSSSGKSAAVAGGKSSKSSQVGTLD